jgi:hypothetical protein
MTEALGFDRRALALLATVVLLPAAIFGYAVGQRHARAPVRERSLTASAANVLLAVPARWQVVSSAPPVPGLALAQSIALAPAGKSAQAGLLAGALPAGESSPLPEAFLAGMRKLPATAVVGLQEVQAYRYTNFDLPGYERTLELYVVPNPGGQPTALACYGSSAQASDLPTCRHMVATLTLAGQSKSFELTPEPAYATALATTISRLDGLRAALRQGMAPGSAPQTVHALSLRLAGAFAQAAKSVESQQATLATGQAQAALSAALLRARGAYRALAAAAGQGDEASFALARGQVAEAERAVDGALESFALLGYGQ